MFYLDDGDEDVRVDGTRGVGEELPQRAWRMKKGGMMVETKMRK